MKKTLAALLAAADPCSRRYIIRLELGQMRLGVGDMTVLNGLAAAFLGSKDDRPPLEHAYNVSSDIGYVAQILAKSGLDGVKRIRVVINRPLRPQLAQRVDTITEVRAKIDSDTISVEEKSIMGSEYRHIKTKEKSGFSVEGSMRLPISFLR
jgi:DNA ligase-1